MVTEVDVRSEELYPSTAPDLAALASALSSSSSTRLGMPESEGGEQAALDFSSFPAAATSDPFAYVSTDLRSINSSIRELLGVDHPILSTVAKYFFDWDGGKKVRPALVLLMAHAVNQHMAATTGGRYTPKGTFSPSASEVEAANRACAAGMPSVLPGEARVALPAQVVLPLQRRLAEITELIHTASLLHDDVIDGADTRRGVGSVNHVFGNKLAILAGDFLLARASVCLARLRNIPCVELLSSVIEHLVKGEVMQMHTSLREDGGMRAAFDVYLRKTYYKTGSLIANSCKGIAILGGYPDDVAQAAYKYGLHVGMAFQLVDDMLGACIFFFTPPRAPRARKGVEIGPPFFFSSSAPPPPSHPSLLPLPLPPAPHPAPLGFADFEGTTAGLGKPALNDITQGLSTAPVLYAALKYPSLLPLLQRKFELPGDVDQAIKGIHASGGMALTRRLALAHGQLALDAIAPLADSPARTALASMVGKVLNRKK